MFLTAGRSDSAYITWHIQTFGHYRIAWFIVTSGHQLLDRQGVQSCSKIQKLGTRSLYGLLGENTRWDWVHTRYSVRILKQT